MDNSRQTNTPTTQPVSTTPKWVIIVLLLIFPPIAFYFMWKEKKYHKWFSYLLIFVGGLTGILGIMQILFVTPKLLELYNNLNTEIPSTHSWVTYFLIIFGIFELMFGYFLNIKLRNNIDHKKLLGSAVGILLLSYLFGGYLQAQSVLTVITPIYNLTSELDTPNSTTISPQSTINNQTEYTTYKSTSLRFTVNYPNTWVTKQSNGSVSFRPQGEVGNDNWGLVVISKLDNKDNLTLDDYINKYLCDSPGVCASAENAKSIVISGVQGKKIINPPTPVPSQTVVVIKDRDVFFLTITLDRSFEELYSLDEKQNIFTNMLSTFEIME